MKPVQHYLNKLGSRKFQILILATSLYIFKGFPAEYLLYVMLAFMGFDVAQKFVEHRSGGYSSRKDL